MEVGRSVDAGGLLAVVVVAPVVMLMARALCGRCWRVALVLLLMPLLALLPWPSLPEEGGGVAMVLAAAAACCDGGADENLNLTCGVAFVLAGHAKDGGAGDRPVRGGWGPSQFCFSCVR